MTHPELTRVAADLLSERPRGYRGRFAPSPTGRIHLGTARTALVAWLRARSHRGAFVMRIEDIDGPRVKAGAAEALLEDLRWIGLDWDEGPDVGGDHGPYVQSQRSRHYLAALDRLREAKRIYRCTCSRREIAEVASAPHGGSGAIYPGTCRARPTHPDRPAAWRFLLDAAPSFHDVLRGPSPPGLGEGDFVVARADGVFAYQLAVTVDDAAMQVTEVVRGDDLFDSTPRQLALLDALAESRPDYLHVPLVLGLDGERLAKRHGATSLAELRDRGVKPEAIVGWLASTLGLVDAGVTASATELIRYVDFARLTAESVRVDPALVFS
ncbi:MAG: tRNA glutamyl-Q(34) synthetase GluQRS [Deltaproteobacteria bacterium]|nr:tRNA glutamyl-Q(34) synthetase GluQRS [Deltaproteobacteria bacterium]